MKYDAITLDTNIFRQNGYNLESGLLGQLTQFKSGSIQLVLSEIVLREISKHMIEAAIKDWIRLKDTVRNVTKSRLISDKSSEDITKLLEAEVKPEDSVKARLDKFIKDTGAIIVNAEDAEMNDLVKLYFEPAAPFEGSGDKKNEFPDAIALLSLDSWAKKHNKKLLAISDDKGWAAYADTSEKIDIEKDISTAFQQFQQHIDHAQTVVSKILTELMNGNNPELLRNIDNDIQQEIEILSPLIDVQSHLSYDVDQVDMSYLDFEFVNLSDNPIYTIIQIGAKKIVAKIPLLINVEASAELSFYVYDSIDKDSINMGSKTAETVAELKMSALITFEGNFDSNPMEVKVTEVTLLEKSPIINFGYIVPFEEYEE